MPSHSYVEIIFTPKEIDEISIKILLNVLNRISRINLHVFVVLARASNIVLAFPNYVKNRQVFVKRTTPQKKMSAHNRLRNRFIYTNLYLWFTHSPHCAPYCPCSCTSTAPTDPRATKRTSLFYLQLLKNPLLHPVL